MMRFFITFLSAQGVGGAKKYIVRRTGNRSPKYNRRVGGSKNSQHLYGKAVEVYVAGRVIACSDLANQIYFNEALRPLFGGYGLGSDTNVHLDIRERKDAGKPVVWWYGKKDASKDGALINESIQWAFRTVFDDHGEYWTVNPYYDSGWQADIRQVKDFQPDAEKNLTLDEVKKNLVSNLDILVKFAQGNGDNNWLTA